MSTRWRPFKTAPKDGRDVLLWFPEDKLVAIGHWEADEAYWDMDGAISDYEPSHWRAIPKGPK